jgi:hypothetical protein
MSDPHLQETAEPTLNENFVKGMRAIFNTTKPQSDKQLAEAAERRKQERVAKIGGKKTPGK